MDNRRDAGTAAIEALVQDYFLGMYEGDVERVQRIFDPQCRLFGQAGDESLQLPLAGFLDLVASEPAPRAAGEAFDMHLVSFDRAGPVAVTRLDVLYRGSRYTDYLLLQRTAEGWRVVSKAFFCPDGLAAATPE